MKKELATLFTILLFLCTISAQEPRPISIQTVDSSTYVVEYIPIEEAAKNVNAQLVQVDKQLQTVDKQIAELVKKRDGLMQQQAALLMLQKQFEQAGTTPPPPIKEAPTPPSSPKKKPKKEKGKN